MRVRVAIVLFALVGIVVAPSEAALAEQSGSVVDQVSSCRQPSGLTRDQVSASELDASCRAGPPTVVPLAILVVLVVAAGGVALVGASRSVGRRRPRWTLAEAVARAGAPWRAPPALV